MSDPWSTNSRDSVPPTPRYIPGSYGGTAWTWPQSTSEYAPVSPPGLSGSPFEPPAPSVLSDEKATKLQLQQVETRIKQLNKKIEEASVDLQSAQKSVDDIERQIKNDKLQAIQILALFVAFFTFVSVEFQLFAKLDGALASLSLSFLLLGALLLFVCLSFLGLAYYNDDQKTHGLSFHKKFLFGVTGVAALCLTIGIGLMIISHNEETYYRNQAIAECRRLSEALQEKPDAFVQKQYINQCTNQ